MSKVVEKFKEGKPGFGCKAGKLFRFEKKSVLVLAPWPKPQAWFNNSRVGWHSSRKRADKVFSSALFAKGDESRDPFDVENDPRLRIWTGDPGRPCKEEIAQYSRFHGLDEVTATSISKGRARVLAARADLERPRKAIAYIRTLQVPFFDAIPEEVRTEILRYGSRRWHLLCLFARCPGALDLSRSNPALCYALASNWVFHKPAVKRPLAAARRLVGKKQRHILGWLGFPATESVRRLLQKIEPGALGVRSLLRMRELLADRELTKWLAHLEHIDGEMMAILNRPWLRPYLTGGLLTGIAAEPKGDQNPVNGSLYILRDTLRMADQFPDHRLPGRFDSLRQLRAIHDTLAEMDRVRWDQQRQVDGWALPPFPNPPFAGTRTIQPLHTLELLYEEGREMGHCIGSYGRRIADGGYYAYKVTAPIRATMGIWRFPQGKAWRLARIVEARNKRVDKATGEAVFRDLLASGPYVGDSEGDTAACASPGEFGVAEIWEEEAAGQLFLFG